MFKAVNSPKNRLNFYKSKVTEYLPGIEDQKTQLQIKEMLNINILGKNTNDWPKLAIFLEGRDFSSKKPVDIYMNLFCMVQLSHTSYRLDQQKFDQYHTNRAARAHGCYFMELGSGQLSSAIDTYNTQKMLRDPESDKFSKKISDFPIMELEKFFRELIEQDAEVLTTGNSFN